MDVWVVDPPPGVAMEIISCGIGPLNGAMHAAFVAVVTVDVLSLIVAIVAGSLASPVFGCIWLLPNTETWYFLSVVGVLAILESKFVTGSDADQQEESQDDKRFVHEL